MSSAAQDRINHSYQAEARSLRRVRRHGLAWGWRTPEGQRFYGIDFGWFGLGVLLDA